MGLHPGVDLPHQPLVAGEPRRPSLGGDGIQLGIQGLHQADGRRGRGVIFGSVFLVAQEVEIPTPVRD